MLRWWLIITLFNCTRSFQLRSSHSAMSRGMYHPHFPPALTHMTAAMGGMGAMGATLPAHTPSDYQATLDSEKVRAAFLPTSLGEFVAMN